MPWKTAKHTSQRLEKRGVLPGSSLSVSVTPFVVCPVRNVLEALVVSAVLQILRVQQTIAAACINNVVKLDHSYGTISFPGVGG